MSKQVIFEIVFWTLAYGLSVALLLGVFYSVFRIEAIMSKGGCP